MLRVLSYLLSIGVHATFFGVVGALVLAGSGDREPELLAGGLTASGSSGSFAMTTAAADPGAEPLPELPAPPSPFTSELPQPELRASEAPLAEIEPVTLEPLAVELGELGEILEAAPAEAGATAALLPFDFQPVAARLLPLRPGPSRARGGNGLADAAAGTAATAVPGTPAAAAAATPPTPTAPPANPGASQAIATGFADTLYAPSIYPRRAVARGIEGEVVLLAQVDADGTVTSCEIETSSGSQLLDDAAHDSLLRWRFKPRRVDGVARAFVARVPFRFTIPKSTPAAAKPS